VVYNGTASQTVTPLTSSYVNLTISNSNATVSATGNFNVTTQLSVSSSSVLDLSSGVVINSAGAAGLITGSGKVNVSHTGSGTGDFAAQYKFSTYTLTSLT